MDKVCCKQLKFALRDGDINYYERENKFYVYGRPDYADDGEQLDDMTETMEMKYCLFCGRKLDTL